MSKHEKIINEKTPHKLKPYINSVYRRDINENCTSHPGHYRLPVPTEESKEERANDCWIVMVGAPAEREEQEKRIQ